MNPLLIAQIIQAALALAETGSQVFTFLTTVNEKITAAQASGNDLTAADWIFINQVAASNIAAAKGYGSVTAALLAAPTSAAPAPAAAAAPGPVPEPAAS
jgi:uncharacterized protein involved in propanediol utilization